jgi:hypothetical protein
VRRLTFAIAACGVVLAAVLTWHTGTIRDETAALEARETRIRPQYQTLLAKEAQTSAATEVADTVARLSTAPNQHQEALLAVFNALPRSAWVTLFAFEDGKATVNGRGLDTESVIAVLKSQPGVSRVAAASGEIDAAGGAGADRSFRVRFEWARESPMQRDQGEQISKPQQ